MINPTVNSTKEDYLHVIYHIASETGDGNLVRNSRIAEILNIKPSSITEMIQKLDGMGYINWIKHRGIKLTREGRELARKIHESNELLSRFLKEHMKIRDAGLVKRIASILEHEVLHEPELKDAIEGVINQPK